MVTIGDKISELPSLVIINGAENIPVQKGGKNYKIPSSIFKNIIAMGIKKSYASVSAMQADGTAPVGNDGTPLKAGDLVSIWNPSNDKDPDNNSIYAFTNPGWSKQSQQYVVDSELSETSTNPVENKAVTKSVNDSIIRGHINSVSCNLLNNRIYDKFIIGGFINKANGNLVEGYDNWMYTDFIPVFPEQQYDFIGKNDSGASSANCFYDINKKFISSQQQENGTIVIPENCYFIRLCTLTTKPGSLTYKGYVSCIEELDNRLQELEGNADVFNNNCFVLFDNSSIPQDLDKILFTTEQGEAITRKMLYEAVKDVKFFNCDKNIKRTLYILWNGYSNKFSFRISKYNADNQSWEEDFSVTNDLSVINPTHNGVFDVTISKTDDQKVIARIDTSRLPFFNQGLKVNNLSQSPDFIFSELCYEDEQQDIVLKDNYNGVVKLYPNTKLPVISFQFDDIVDNDQQVYELFKEYGFTCGFAFMASDAKIKLYKDKYLEWQRQGFQILNHSLDSKIFNTDNYTYDTALSTIIQAKRKLELAGFVVNGWVSPSSSMAEEFLPIIKLSHAYGFTKSDEHFNGRESNPCQLIRYSLESNTIEAIKSKIDSDISNNKILVFYGHSANFGNENATSKEVWDINKLRTVLEYCIDKMNKGLCYIGGNDDVIKYYFSL